MAATLAGAPRSRAASRAFFLRVPRPLLLPLALAAALVVVTSVPYVYAYATQPRGHEFLGFFFLADDANTYLAKMREGLQGSWLWTNHYTMEPSPGAYFFTFWLALGHLAGVAHLSLIVTYQAARVVGAFALLLAAWMFICHFVEEPAARRFAIVFCALGLGWGYVIQALGHPLILGVRSDTLDWRMPELSVFYSVLALPHFVWAAAFQAAAAVLTLRAADKGSLRLAALAGLAWLGESSIHAQMPILVGGAVVVAAVARPVGRRGWAAVGLALAIAAPYIAYSYLGYRTSPEVARWSDGWRNNLPPEGVSLLLALGPQLALALLGLPGALRRRSREDVFLLAWLVLLIAILWLPTPAANLRRRFFDGVYLPLVVLAARGLYEQVVPRLRSLRMRRLIPFTYVVVAAVGSAFLVLAPLKFAARPPYTMPAAQLSGVTWLAKEPTGAVLSSPSMGLLVPAYTSDTVYVGQYSETYRYAEKGRQAYRLLTGRADLRAFVNAEGIRYVLWTDEFGGRPPSVLGKPAYSAPGVRVYRLY